MIRKKRAKMSLVKAVFGVFFLMMGFFTGVVGIVLQTTPTYAVESTNTVEEANESQAESTENNATVATASTTTEDCKSSLGALGWLICPTTGKIAEAVDWLYEKIEDILVINPIEMKDGTPIYEIWKYCRSITNIVFIIFFLVVIYSQLTGVGISNYGIKKVLPKMIVVAILVNLSFLICSLMVDVSNIVGDSLRGVFTAIEESTMTANGFTASSHLSMGQMYAAMAGGTALAIGAGIVAFETGAIWMLIPTVLGAIVAVASGLITIALRQAVVALLIMISPLAVVAYMLPNTEDLFKKWKKLLTRMLVFYPMFSLLFGASQLAGFAIIASAGNGFGILLGVAVQVFPLFFSWKLMQMSGTFLGDINTRLRGLATRPLATNRAWADSHRQLTRQAHLARNKAYTPSLRLMQFISNRRVAREEEISEHAETVKLRGQAYNVRRKYGRNGMPGKGAEEDYAEQAEKMQYSRTVDWHKNNLNKGLGQLAVVQNASAAKRARLNALDAANVGAADMLFAEKARGEKIEYDNAMGRYKRFEAAMNAHFDDKYGGLKDGKGRSTYKLHDVGDRSAARTRYLDLNNIMEGDVRDTQFVVANAAQAYDTQKKIVETKMQKYFELTPPTKDVEYRLGELTQLTAAELRDGKKAANNIDAILPGLRILNQRGDTDLLKAQLDNVLNSEIGGGIELGTHASQALASFLMFEVKDNDPFLRRFGKYINLETARAYNANDRQVMDVTYDEYIKGYHDGETQLVGESNPTGRMYAKKAMRQLVEGTSLDNIERTALSNLDDSLKQAYGYHKGVSSDGWDIDGYLRKREEIQTAFEPAFLSASLKWLSGSEQINSAVKFWTGYEQKQRKDEHGNVMTDENGDPIYELSPVWKGDEFAGREGEVEKYYRRKTSDYFKDQTTGQILGMRTDYRDATMEHLVESFLEDSSEDETSDERKRKHEADRAEIQTRYSDKDPEEAKKLREKDLKKLKMDLAGRQLRKILGKTGKLEQIYRTRRSGAANNAKDWLRGWVNLDNESALRNEVVRYQKEQQQEWEEEMRLRKESDPSFEYEPTSRIYNESDRRNFESVMSDINEDYKDEDRDTFFRVTRDQLDEWFPGDYVVWQYEKYFENNPYADNDDLYSWIKELLEDLDRYPGNRDKK